MTYAGHPDQRWGPTSYAQHGDDFMILNLFELIGIKQPSYLDIGAHHPTTISNTRLLYERGSRGVNVEANWLLLRDFERERPEDKNVCFGVVAEVPESGYADFYKFSDTSGVNSFSPAEVKRLERFLTVQGSERVPVTTINGIVKDYCGLVWPDLLNIDIEGLDYDVLASAVFLPGPSLIVVETRQRDRQLMTTMLENKNYAYYCRMGANLFFVRRDHWPAVCA